MNNQQTARDPYLNLLNVMRGEAEGIMPLWYCIGTVLEAGEKNLSVQAMGHTLTEEDLKINDALRATWLPDEEMDIAMEDGLVFSGRLSGTIPGCGYGGGHSSFAVAAVAGGKLCQEKAKVKTPWKLAPGDTVLLIPDQEQQFYYLVMKVVDYGTIPPDRTPQPAQ